MEKVNFNFPYEHPYQIQEEFMQVLYEVLTEKKHAILESPTGTGKSLSLICSCLSWFELNTDSDGFWKEEKQVQVQEKTNSSEPDWLRNYSAGKLSDPLEAKKKLIRNHHSQIDQLRRQRGLFSSTITPQKRKKTHLNQPKHSKKAKLNFAEEEFLLTSYDSNEDTNEVLSDSEEEENDQQQEEEEKALGLAKIIYCSRTHSQISQFLKEIQKTKFGQYDQRTQNSRYPVQSITLGSRKSLCINPNVNQLKSDLQMADKCLDLLQNKSSSKTKSNCQYYNQSTQKSFRNQALTSILDIEELNSMGEKNGCCSYFGSRKSLPYAQVVAIPYSILLNRKTRNSVGLDIKNSIIIIDEAHNLIDGINQTHTVILRHNTLSLAKLQLESYLEKYQKRLKGKNVFYIKQLLSILKAFEIILQEKNSGNRQEHTTEMFDISDFVFMAKVDHFNLFKIQNYLRRSKISQKLMGFSQHSDTDDNDGDSSKHISPFSNIESFFMTLTNSSEDGRVVLTNVGDSNTLDTGSSCDYYFKFILLNPAVHFQEIIDDARSVILAGGTMQPVSHLVNQVFPTLPKNKLRIFSCGHVIPPENLLGVCVSRGPSGIPFDFTFADRDRLEIIDELGRLLFNLCNAIPAGVVLFFPSYSYERKVMDRLLETGQYQKISDKKRIFREGYDRATMRSTSTSESLLQEYTTYLDINKEKLSESGKGGGAILSSVVGGKMSEGINFSDHLARCVIVIGLPYPNANDPELKARIQYLEENKKDTSSVGREYYMNLCMNGVNQSIGRSIRHKEDYSSIILLDRRYSQANIRNRLPQWINQQTHSTDAFGKAYSLLVKFFKRTK